MRRISKQILFLFLVTALVASACKATAPSEAASTVPPASSGNSKAVSNLVYKEIAGVAPSLFMLDIYTNSEFQNAPVVIFIHGGGWTSGDKSNVNRGEQFVAFFQRNHAILVSANIRLMQSDLAPNTTYREQASDVASVVRWTRDHIAEYGGDPNRIALFGFSSGAHLSALVGADETYLRAEGLDLTALKCVMSFDVDAYDIPRAIAEGAQYNYPAAARNLPSYFTANVEIQKAASPMTYIEASKTYPAFLVVYTGVKNEQPGGEQQELGKRQSELFVEALRSVGVPATLFGDLSLTHTQLAMEFGKPDFEATNIAQAFLDEFFWGANP